MLERCRSLLHIGHIFILIIIAFLLHTNTLTKNLILLTFGTSNSTCSTRVFNWNPSHVLCRIERKGMIDKPIAVELTSSTFGRVIIVQIQILNLRTSPTCWYILISHRYIETCKFILCWICGHQPTIWILNISFNSFYVDLCCFISLVELHWFCLLHWLFRRKVFIKFIEIRFICFVSGIESLRRIWYHASVNPMLRGSCLAKSCSLL